MKRIGFYLWGGPGIIDLLKVKYPRPRIDVADHLKVYDVDYLQKAQTLLGITDVWATFSWGFSDKHEQPHRNFIKKKLSAMQQLGLRVHGYVQGFNVVTADFRGQDIFCRDHKNKLLPYSRGRSFICPNNPQAVALLQNRVTQACELDFDGIYIDNVLFGLHPFFVSQEMTSFFGCSCKYCQEKFKSIYGYDLPLATKRGKKIITDYLEFRADSILTALASLQKIVKQHHKEFGVNLYDFHRHNSKVFFGYDLQKIDSLLDYYLIENHSFVNSNALDNSYLAPTIAKTKKPIFVLSYKNGIGREKKFGQKQLDLIYEEANRLGYSHCIKGSEYLTKGVWHVLDLNTLRKPSMNLTMSPRTKGIKKKTLRTKPVFSRHVSFWSRYYSGLLRFIYNNRFANKFVHRFHIYTRAVRSIKNFDI